MIRSAVVALSTALICCQCGVGYAAERKVSLSVPGMNCPACPVTVRKSLERVAGVAAVAVSLDRKEATVIFDDTGTTVRALTQATADAGYPSTAIDDPAK